MRLSILECGAVADGVTLCTDAINTAINKVAEAGGGYVIVPPGEFVSGTIVLKSNVYLFLEPGSFILGSMDINDLEVAGKTRNHLTQIYGEEIDNSGILGHGTFDLRRANYHTKPKLNGRPLMIVVKNSTNLTFEGVTLLNPGWFTISCENNTNVKFDRLILNTRNCENGDGIDFNGSKNVTISNCKINAGDDAIGLKTGPTPCENFTITNCVISSQWAGIRIGPESSKDMLNITVSNCVFNDCSDGIKLQNFGGCRFEDFTFSNLTMVNILRPFFFTYNPSRWWRDKNGTFKRVLISNIIARMGKRPEEGWFEDMMVINGLPTCHIEDVMINNMHVIAPGGGVEDDGSSAENEELFNYTRFPDLEFQWEPYPGSCMYIRHADRVRLNNCVFETALPDKRPAIAAQHVDGLKITNAEVFGTEGLVRHYKVNGLSVVNSEGYVTGETPEYHARAEEFRKFTEKIEREMIANDDFVGRVNAMNRVADLTIPEGTEDTFEVEFDHDGGEAYLRMDRIRSSPRVWLNGKEVYFWDRNNHYEYPLPIAVDQSSAVISGKNTLKVKLEGQENNFETNTVSIYSPLK